MKVAIIGSGGHARSVAGVAIEELRLPVQAFIDIHDDLKKNETIYDIPVLPGKSQLESTLVRLEIDTLILAVGDNKLRDQLFSQLKNNFNFPNIISNSANIKKSATLGKGNVILCLSYLGPFTSIGDNNIINTRATLEHECVIGSSNHIAPSSTLLGRVSIENLNLVGSGSIIKPSIALKSNITVGANSFVNKNILEAGTYFGSPAAFQGNS